MLTSSQRLTLLNALSDATVEVHITFKKVNGKTRRMKAWLTDPNDGHPFDKSQKVMDLDLNAYRSFRWDNIKSYKVTF